MNIRRSDKMGIALSLIGLLLYSFILKVFYPGYMSFDSGSQLQEARAGVFTDWHPPAMSFLWRKLDQIYPGPFLMLALFVGIYLLGAGLLAASTSSSIKKAVLKLCLFALFPPALALLSTIWKDVDLGACALFATACLVRAERSTGRGKVRWLITSAVFLFGAVALRHNGLIAVVPLMMGLVYVGLKDRRPFWFGTATFFVLLLTTLFALRATNRYLTKGQSLFPVQQILLHDLTAISLGSHEIWLPSESFLNGKPPASVDELKPLYSPSMVVPLFSNPTGNTVLTISKDPATIRKLWGNWLNAIQSHPRLYFLHRLKVFRLQMAFLTPEVCYPMHFAIDVPKSLNVTFQPTRWTWKVQGYLSFFANTFIFRGWFYLAALALLIFVSLTRWKNRRRSFSQEAVTLAVSTSGFLYGIAYLFIGTTCDFRMHWWTVIATLVAIMLVVRSERTKTFF